MQTNTLVGFEDKLNAIRMINNYDDLQKQFTSFISSKKELPQLLPHLIELLERFGYRNSMPAIELVDAVKELLQTKEELKQYIPRLIDLSGETWIYSLATVETQKIHLYAQINEHILLAEFDKAVYLIRISIKNNVLNEEQLISLLGLSLSHSGMYQIIQVLLPEIQKRYYINEEIIKQALSYITTFSTDTHINHQLINYLNDCGVLIPSYYEIYYSFLNQSNLSNYISQQVNPTDTNQKQDYTVWDTYQRWQTSYPKWPLYEGLEEELKPQWLQDQLATKIDNKIALSHTSQWFALTQYSAFYKLSINDLLAIGRAYRIATKKTTLAYFADSAACLFTKRWNETFVEAINTHQTIPSELREIASELMLAQLIDWVGTDKTNEIAPVAPMYGISLDYLYKQWKKGIQKWNTVWDSYKMIIENKEQTLSEEFDFTVRFHPLKAMYHNYIIEFLIYTEAPQQNAKFRQNWLELLQIAKKTNNNTFIKILHNVPIKIRNRVAISQS